MPDDESIVLARLTRFDDALRQADTARQIRAVESIATTIHPLVADALLDLASTSDRPEVVAATYRALSHQSRSKARVVTHVRDVLRRAADTEATFLAELAKLAKLATNDVAAATPRTRIRDRGHVLTKAQRCLVALESPDPELARALRAFLADPSDELVVATLDTLAAWHTSQALPDVVELFQAYPCGDRFTSSNPHAAITDEWNALLGRRERPEVHHGIRRFLKTLTNRTFTSPVELEGYLQDANLTNR